MLLLITIALKLAMLTAIGAAPHTAVCIAIVEFFVGATIGAWLNKRQLMPPDIFKENKENIVSAEDPNYDLTQSRSETVSSVIIGCLLWLEKIVDRVRSLI